jgi:hypothetical protein
MPRLSSAWLAVPALVLALPLAAAPAAAMSVGSQALVDLLRERNPDRADRIARRLQDIEAQRLPREEEARLKDAFLKAEIEKAEGDERVAAQFGSAEGQATARAVTALLKALRAQEKWDADPNRQKTEADNKAAAILNGAGGDLWDAWERRKLAIHERNRRIAEEDANILRETPMERPPRPIGQVPGSATADWDAALRYAGEFSGFRIAGKAGFLGQERVGTTNRHLGLVQPSDSSDEALRSVFSILFNTTGSILPLKPWGSDVPTETWIGLGGQTGSFDRESRWDRLDVGPDHRLLIPGTGDPWSPDAEGFSVGPGGGFNLVRDLVFDEETDMWTVWAKGGQSCDYGTFQLSAYAMAAYTQIDTQQHFRGVLLNVPPSLDFRYDTHVDTGVATFGAGLQARYPLSFMPGLSLQGGAFAGADFVRSSGRDLLRVERPGFFVSTQFVDMRQTDVSFGYEANVGLNYDFGGGFSAGLTARYGSHDTGLDIVRTGTSPSAIQHASNDSWSAGLEVSWRR